MSGATTAALITAAAGIGTAAYTARQQDKAQDRSIEASKNAARRSQTQGSDPTQTFLPRRRGSRAGFDVLAQIPMLGSQPATGVPSKLGS